MPFLDALLRVPEKPLPADSDIEAQVKNLKTPCLLKLFIAPECPFCPRMVQDLAPLASINDLVKLTIIDGLLFQEMAAPLDVKSAPTLLLDDRMRWTGRTSLLEIVDVMVNQDPSHLSAASIEGLLWGRQSGIASPHDDRTGNDFPEFLCAADF